MAKREFVPLAHVRKPQSSVAGWFASVKLDGERAVWIPPSAGMRKADVPFSNKPASWQPRDASHVATGLWTRNGNIIHAPIDFISQLPPFPVDLELYAGPGMFQFLRSVVSKFEPDRREWERITACILDAVDMRLFLQPALIKTRNSTVCITAEAQAWWLKQACPSVPQGMAFVHRHEWLQRELVEAAQCVLVPQTRLATMHSHAEDQLAGLLEGALGDGDEGIIVKSPVMPYECARTYQTLKVVPQDTMDGVVVGYMWGREPDNRRSMSGAAYGIRLGAMGGVILRLADNKTLILSGTGFTLEDSLMSYRESKACAADEGIMNPGSTVADNIENLKYPRGSVLTFRYRTLSDTGIPINARFWRRRD